MGRHHSNGPEFQGQRIIASAKVPVSGSPAPSVSPPTVANVPVPTTAPVRTQPLNQFDPQLFSAAGSFIGSRNAFERAVSVQQEYHRKFSDADIRGKSGIRWASQTSGNMLGGSVALVGTVNNDGWAGRILGGASATFAALAAVTVRMANRDFKKADRLRDSARKTAAKELGIKNAPRYKGYYDEPLQEHVDTQRSRMLDAAERFATEIGDQTFDRPTFDVDALTRLSERANDVSAHQLELRDSGNMRAQGVAQVHQQTL